MRGENPVCHPTDDRHHLACGRLRPFAGMSMNLTLGAVRPCARAVSRATLLAVALLALLVLGAAVSPQSALADPVPTGSIVGTVTARNAGGRVEGAQVWVSGCPSATTDSDGRYVLGDVPIGRHDVHFAALGYAPDYRSSVDVTADTTTCVSIELDNIVLVSGRVLASDTGLGLSGTQVLIFGDSTSNAGRRDCATSLDGTWSAWLTAGAYHVNLWEYGEYEPASNVDAFSIGTTQIGILTRLDYVQVKQGLITGHLTETWRGSALPGARVEVWPTTGPVDGTGVGPVSAADADANGDYSVAAPPGDWVLRVFRYTGGGLPQTFPLVAPDLSAGQSPIHVVSNETTTFDMVCQAVPDNTKPTVTIGADNIENGLSFTGEAWSAQTPSVWVCATDPFPWGLLSSISYRVNDGPTQTLYGDRAGLGTYDQGDWHFEYWATDLAGNVSNHVNWTLHVDHDPPSAPATVTAFQFGTGDTTVRWAASPSTDVAAYGVLYTTSDVVLNQYADGLPGFVTYELVPASTRSFVHAGGGTLPWRYAVFPVDRAGNRGPTAECAVRHDTVAPLVACDAAASYDDKAAFSVIATDHGGSGVATISYSLDRAPIKQTTGDSVSLLVTGACVHTLEFWASDVLGNVSVHKVVHFTVAHREYQLSSVTAPRKVSRTKRFVASILVAPAFTGGGTPVVFVVQRWQGGAWRQRMTMIASKSRHGKGTMFYARVRLGRAGRWRIRAVYSDALNPWHATSYRLVTAR